MLTSAVVLAADAIGRQIVSIHAKVTYRLLPSGACELAAEQAALLNVEGDRLAEGLPPESDVIPYKAATDLIVMASAHAPRGRPVARLSASIDCGELHRGFLVQGERRCVYRGRGSIAFSRPEAFTTIPLRYERAYGGCDPHVVAPEPRTLSEAMTPHPGIYPRNPAGRGYVVNETRALIDGLLLPNVENPHDPLEPDRLITGSQQRWWRQPLPWSCDWFDLSWYPRSVFLGGVPDFLPDDDRQVEEVRRGYVPGSQNARFRKATLAELFDPRFSDAASPGLVVPFMRGDEAIRLCGLTPEQELVVRLPGQRPRMEVRYARGRGMKTIEVTPVPNRVLISTDEMGVYVVWHGAFAPPPAVLEGLFGAETEPAIEAYVDGKPAPLLS
jgi:hypothetical protein